MALARGWRRGHAGESVGTKNLCGGAQHGRRRWFESGKINGNNAIGEFMGVPISTICCISSSMCGTLSSALPGCFCWRRFWPRSFSGSGRRAPVGYGCGTLCRIESCAVFGAVRNLRRNFGCGALEALFDERPDGSAKNNSPHVLRVPTSAAILLTAVFCAIALLRIADFVSNRTYVVFNPDLRFGTGEASWFLPARRLLFGGTASGKHFRRLRAWWLRRVEPGPKYPDFIDGRGNNPDLSMEQFNLYSEDPDSPAWQTEAERWNLNVLLVATANLRGLRNMDAYKFCQSASWRPVYMDDVSLVFLRNTPGNSSLIRRLQIDCSTQALAPPASASRSALHDFYLNSGELFLFCIGMATRRSL